MHGCPTSGSLFTPIANDDVVDARRPKTRLPKYFSENGEKLCFFDLQNNCGADHRSKEDPFGLDRRSDPKLQMMKVTTKKFRREVGRNKVTGSMFNSDAQGIMSEE